MEVSVRIDYTPGEARRLSGAPDLLPLHQLLALALEDWLICVIAGLDPDAPRLPRAAPEGEPGSARSSSAA